MPFQYFFGNNNFQAYAESRACTARSLLYSLNGTFFKRKKTAQHHTALLRGSESTKHSDLSRQSYLLEHLHPVQYSTVRC
jgi:hypothetical protein